MHQLYHRAVAFAAAILGLTAGTAYAGPVCVAFRGDPASCTSGDAGSSDVILSTTSNGTPSNTPSTTSNSPPSITNTSTPSISNYSTPSSSNNSTPSTANNGTSNPTDGTPGSTGNSVSDNMNGSIVDHDVTSFVGVNSSNLSTTGSGSDLSETITNTKPTEFFSDDSGQNIEAALPDGPAAVPEPGSLSVLAASLAGFGLFCWRRRKGA